MKERRIINSDPKNCYGCDFLQETDIPYCGYMKTENSYLNLGKPVFQISSCQGKWLAFPKTGLDLQRIVLLTEKYWREQGEI